MVRMAIANTISARDLRIVTDFCLGDTPKEIDRRNMFIEGTSRNVISGWWADDKEFRNGGIETVLGRDWKEIVRKRMKQRKF